MSKQSENTKCTSKGGGWRTEVRAVRIDKPANREARRARARALARGTAVTVYTGPRTQSLAIPVDVVESNYYGGEDVCGMQGEQADDEVLSVGSDDGRTETDLHDVLLRA